LRKKIGHHEKHEKETAKRQKNRKAKEQNVACEGKGFQRLGGGMRPEDLLDNVHDRESFVAFAWALAEERDRAEEIERANPNVYIVDGALGWMNGSIGQFIGAGLTHFEPRLGEKLIEIPTWQDLAMFLYLGKIYE
jgi:hypothetical protein